MKSQFLINVCLMSTFTACGLGNITSSEKTSVDDTTISDENQVPQDSGSSPDIPEEDTSESRDDETGFSDTGDETETEILTDFSQIGPHTVGTQERSTTVSGCSPMSYTTYSPEGVSDPVTVVLGHGFGRGAGTMTGWGEHLASWGVRVLLPTLCHYNILSGVDHELNGQNMIELADIEGSVQTIYGGHSAGGLAAIIAASQDPGAVGVFGLDATDTQDVPGVEDFIGREYAGDITHPAFGIVGEPSSCNGENNGLLLFGMMGDASVVKVTDADHCDFESPTDFVCEFSCEDAGAEFSDEEIHEVVKTLSTAAVVSLAGISTHGSLIWDEGLEDWVASGIVQELE